MRHLGSENSNHSMENQSNTSLETPSRHQQNATSAFDPEHLLNVPE